MCRRALMPRRLTRSRSLTTRRGASQRHIPRGVAVRLADRVARSQLSAREIEVLRLLVSGRRNREIAGTLQRSPELTQGCSAQMDHPEFPRMTRASQDAHEVALLPVSSVVCPGPPGRPSAACVFGDPLSDRSPCADASVVASA
jgi:hypothetical protein